MSEKLTLKQGEAKTITFTVKDADGVVVDLSDAELALGVKLNLTDTAYAIEKDDTDFETTQAAQGIVSVELAEADTNLTPGTYVGELKCSWTGPPIVINKSANFYLQIKVAVIPVAPVVP
jgi:hypothetical protein